MKKSNGVDSMLELQQFKLMLLCKQLLQYKQQLATFQAYVDSLQVVINNLEDDIDSLGSGKEEVSLPNDGA